MLPRPVVSRDNEEVDPDVQLLLTSSEPLLQSYNPAVCYFHMFISVTILMILVCKVVLAVVRVFYYIAPPSQSKKIIQPMLRLLHVSSEVERTVIPYLLMVSQSLMVRFSPLIFVLEPC
jgi:AP-3 complex subunit beta